MGKESEVPTERMFFLDCLVKFLSILLGDPLSSNEMHSAMLITNRLLADRDATKHVATWLAALGKNIRGNIGAESDLLVGCLLPALEPPINWGDERVIVRVHSLFHTFGQGDAWWLANSYFDHWGIQGLTQLRHDAELLNALSDQHALEQVGIDWDGIEVAFKQLLAADV
jgi:hypothetical protein